MGDIGQKPLSKRPRTVNILVTGFGAFRNTRRNPSWESVKLLSQMEIDSGDARKQISIDICYVPVEYEYIIGALSYYHGNSEREPHLPRNMQEDPEVSARDEFDNQKHYDFFLHVGQGRSGGVQLETKAHQLGYRLLDAAFKLAPTQGGKEADDEDVSSPERMMFGEERNAGLNRGYPVADHNGIGLGEHGDLTTNIDTQQLAGKLSDDFPEFHIAKSTNAGRYLCEFIYFASLAESKLSAKNNKDIGVTLKTQPKVLFVHVPPENDPLKSQDMADVLRRIVQRVCAEIPGQRSE